MRILRCALVFKDVPKPICKRVPGVPELHSERGTYLVSSLLWRSKHSKILNAHVPELGPTVMVWGLLK